MSYNKARRILKNHDQKIEGKQLYNITQAEQPRSSKQTKKSLYFFLITSESASTLEFVETQLDEFFFPNSLRSEVISGDFAKGLAKALATRETQRHAEGGDRSYIL